MRVFSVTVQNRSRKVALQRSKEQTIVSITLEQKLGQAVAKAANSIVKKDRIRHFPLPQPAKLISCWSRAMAQITDAKTLRLRQSAADLFFAKPPRWFQIIRQSVT